MAAPVNGKLSSRVMNMKFMKKAEQVEQENEEVEKVSKLKNSAEWTLGNGFVKQSVQKPVKRPVALGATAILSMSAATPGRRVFGRAKKEPAEAPQELEAADGSKKNEDEKDLDELFKESVNKNKRQSTKQKSNKKNKKAKRK